MLGYITNKKDYFKGNIKEYNLKKGVSFSGGTAQHYNFFKGIMNYSIVNKVTNIPLHDAKAGEFSLYLFPLKIQSILSIAYYKYEQNLFSDYPNQVLLANNVLLPSEQLINNTIITGNNISFELLDMLDNTVLSSFDLTNVYNYFNIKNLYIDFNTFNLLQTINTILRFFNVNSILIEDYLQLIKENNRLKTITLASNTLNYKPQSIKYLTEALVLWQQSSNI